VIEISENQYFIFLCDQALLANLYNSGVDNWDGYDDAVDAWDEERKAIKEFVFGKKED